MPRKLSPRDLERAEMARLNLLRFRRELGFSAAVVAERAQIPLDTYRQLERGTRRLTNTSLLMDVAGALGHRLDDFFDRDPPPHEVDRLALIGLKVLPGASLDADLWEQLRELAVTIEGKQRWRNRRK